MNIDNNYLMAMLQRQLEENFNWLDIELSEDAYWKFINYLPVAELAINNEKNRDVIEIYGVTKNPSILTEDSIKDIMKNIGIAKAFALEKK